MRTKLQQNDIKIEILFKYMKILSLLNLTYVITFICNVKNNISDNGKVNTLPQNAVVYT